MIKLFSMKLYFYSAKFYDQEMGCRALPSMKLYSSPTNIEQIPHIINRIGYYLTLTGQNAAGNRMVPSSYKAYPPGQPQSNAVVNILYPRIALSAAYMGSEVQPCEKPR